MGTFILKIRRTGWRHCYNHNIIVVTPPPKSLVMGNFFYSLSLYRYVLIDMSEIFDYTASASSLKEAEHLKTFRNMNLALKGNKKPVSLHACSNDHHYHQVLLLIRNRNKLSSRHQLNHCGKSVSLYTLQLQCHTYFSFFHGTCGNDLALSPGLYTYSQFRVLLTMSWEWVGIQSKFKKAKTIPKNLACFIHVVAMCFLPRSSPPPNFVAG